MNKINKYWCLTVYLNKLFFKALENYQIGEAKALVRFNCNSMVYHQQLLNTYGKTMGNNYFIFRS
jgi:hypothetical protein